MEKIQKYFEVVPELEWEGLTEISELKLRLEELEQMGATHIRIEPALKWGESYVSIEALSYRFETEEEYTKRVSELNRRERISESMERMKLANLKQKYEK